MAIIDERGAQAISGWFKEKADIPHTITILTDKPVNIKVENDRDKAFISVLFMRNGIKFIVDDINNISKN